MRPFLLAAIRFYQRFLSPLKGYVCAFRVHTGRCSCSALGYRAMRRFGALHGLAVLRRRLYLCGVAFRRYSSPPRRPPAAQRGDCDIGLCDLPCDGGCHSHCHVPGGQFGRFIGDLASCGDCGSCDWPSRNKKRDDKEEYVYIPPNLSDGKKDRG